MIRRFFSSPRRWQRLLTLGVLCGLTLAPAQTFAQGRDDGSLYSRFGLGDLRAFASPQIQAMGGGGTALWSWNYTNFGNPASWGRQRLVRAVVGVRLDGVRTTDASDNSKRLTSGSLTAIQFGIPLREDNLGLGLAFQPYSRISYHVQTQDQLITDPSVQDTTLYQVNFEGTGGLQQIRGGLGVRVSDALTLGASVDFIFGILEEARRTQFASVEFAETNLATSTRLFGVTGTLGAIFTFSNLAGQNNDLSIATSFTLPTSLEGDRALTLGESLSRDTLGAQIDGTIELPLSARFGIAYETDNRWTLVADARYEPWSQFDSDLSFPGYTPGDARLFRDRLRLSAGVEWLPAGANLLDSYLKRVAYRLGFYYDQAYVTPVEGIDINTLALTGGLSLPAFVPGTRLDINVEVGTRGTTEQNLVRDVFYGVSVTLNIGERWFVKRKLR